MKSLLISSVILAMLAATPTLAASPSDEGPLTISVAYAFTVNPGGGHPGIWAGGTNVTFIGTSDPFDAGAIKLHNQNPFNVTVLKVSVDIGEAEGINPWATELVSPFNVIPPGGQLILTQTAFFNFDTSDILKRGASCGPNKAVIHVTEKVGSATPITYSFLDSLQILTTGAGCGAVKNQWAKVEPVNDGGVCK